MTGHVLVVNRMRTVGGKLRDEGVQKINDIAQYGLEKEPGMLKYAILVPRDDDGKTVYTIEEYTDKAAFEQHLTVEPVALLSQWGTDNAVLDPDEPFEHQMLQYLPGLQLTRPSDMLQSGTGGDPHIVFTEMEFADAAGAESSVPLWKTAAKEEGTLVFGVLRDVNREERTGLLEVYEGVGGCSPVVDHGLEETKGLRKGTKKHALKMVAGFLCRDTWTT